MKVIGHRGTAGLAPENTFAGFDLALALGVDGIETVTANSPAGSYAVGVIRKEELSIWKVTSL